MAYKIILLSGRISSGKTELANVFGTTYGATVFKTNDFLKKTLAKSSSLSRHGMQKGGEKLDKKDGGIWVAQALAAELQELPASVDLIIVDSIRIRGQAAHIRKMFGSSHTSFGSQVFHLHVTASAETLEKRYAKRKSSVKEFKSYKETTKNQTERQVESLKDIADIVIPTDNITIEDVLVRASAHLNLYPRTAIPLVDVLVGGQYGSEGKGHIAAHLAPDYDCLMRVGGPNAGHKVYETSHEKKATMTFHHLPSGTMRNPKAKVFLGAGSVLRLPSLLDEIRKTEIDSNRLKIDRNALIIEDSDISKESENLVKKISSTGQGVGAAVARKILERDPDGSVRLAADVTELKPFLADTVFELERLFQKNQRVLLEGTQGTSLSLHHGKYPFVTSRDTTVSGCISEAGISPRRVRKVIVVCRTFPIRVGGPSGPMKNEISRKAISDRSKISYSEIRRTERTSTTDKVRRISEFDWEQLKRTVILNGPTEIALTFADYLDIKNRDARRFEQLTEETIRFIEEVERVSGVPVTLISTRFKYRSIIDRRAW